MKPLGKKMIAIATTARQLTERFAKEHSGIGDRWNLECYCAIGSKILKLLEEKYGYDVTFVQGQYGSDFITTPGYLNHCWTEYNSRIIDVTATQFGIKEKVHIISVKEAIKYFPVHYHDKVSADWGDQNPGKYPSIRKMVANTVVK